MRRGLGWVVALLLGCGGVLVAQQAGPQQQAGTPQQVGTPALGVTPELVLPSQANANVHASDEPNVVLVPPHVAPDAPLAIFMPGTGGKPQNTMRLLQVVASQGYRVIGLSYDDEVAGSILCWKRPNPLCLERFREMRCFARGEAAVQNSYAESIEGRLVSLLRYLNRQHPDAGWGQYLAEDGQPRWPRILLSGLSQGAGMAAFIAKQKPVYRVVLFSSPWDFLAPDKRPAEWMFRPSVTPPERWWAERHARENTTEQLATAYRALRVPRDQTFVFNQDLPPGFVPKGDNPYHPSTVSNPAYEGRWRQMYGSVSQP